MEWIFFPIRDFFVLLFESILEPLGNTPNLLYLIILLGGACYWMYLQFKLNKKAEETPGQIK